MITYCQSTLVKLGIQLFCSFLTKAVRDKQFILLRDENSEFFCMCLTNNVVVHFPNRILYLRKRDVGDTSDIFYRDLLICYDITLVQLLQ